MGRERPGSQSLVELAEQVRAETGLPVMISPGVLPGPVLDQISRSGIPWYACYQETHNPSLYHRLRQGQDFNERWAAKQWAANAGMLIEEGVLTGVGESSADLAASIVKMRDFPVDQARVMTFVPHPDTPMAGMPTQNPEKELIIIAVMRLLMPDRLIPASLDVGGLDGLGPRLEAGANVVTSIVPPEQGLAGVANYSLDIEASRRSTGHILPVLEHHGLRAATAREYQDWVDQRQLFKSKYRYEAPAC